jgi:Spy/CpxP family protein refolding chaperone
MHPGFFSWWKSRYAGGGCGGESSCSPRGHWGHGHGHGGHQHHGHGEHEQSAASEGEGPFSGFGGGGPFGVRRPLRFMAHKLGLREDQIAELAALLDELKTERAQADVDYRRSLGTFAEALAGGAFDVKRANEAADARVKSTERVQKAVLKTLEKTHALLDEEQRKKLGYLLRTGVLTI